MKKNENDKRLTKARTYFNSVLGFSIAMIALGLVTWAVFAMLVL